MYSTDQLQNLINKHIAEVPYPSVPSELYEPIRYILSMGGKRLRPSLVLMACDLFHGSVLQAIKPAVGIEMFHNFTLMHDDIMDKAPLRRGKPTVHVKWNESVAILSGDAMLVEAYKLISQVEDARLRKVLEVFNTVATGVCEGQQLDMNFELSENVTIGAYMDMIRLKTAVLLGGSLQIGALIGNAPDHFASDLYSFGENLGIAFQLQDDLLDVFGDPDKFGKQVGGDIISNKKTFLLIKAMELAEGLDAEELLYWMNAENVESNTKVQSVTAIYNRLGVRELAELEMSTYAEVALSKLDRIEVASERKDTLRQFAEKMLIREN